MSRVIALFTYVWLAMLVCLTFTMPVSAEPSTTSLQVTVDLGAGYRGALSGIKLNYMLSGTQPYAGVLALDNTGKATLTDIIPGTYTLSLTGSHWVRRVISGVVINGTNTVQTALANGDADGGNSVNLFDIVVLDSRFNSSDAMADLDGDGKVNLFDYVLIDTNFGAQGDASAYAMVNPKDEAEMVLVGAGDFTMGSTDSSYLLSDARPQRKVTLSSYWIYKYEVTVTQYRKFCTDTSRLMPDPPSWGWIDSHPMVNVTWADAAAYCAWAGGRLPSEAEWEKAARGTDARLYPWGNVWDSTKCANPSNSTTTMPVGSYPSGISPYGCMDMTGNAYEWCADWYDSAYYATAPATNPTGPASGDSRILRGGSWLFDFAYAFSLDYRNYYGPDYRYDSFGFRCAKTP